MALGATLVASAGCAIGGGSAPLLPMVWPEPPQTARIEFVIGVASERDFESGFSLATLINVGLIGRQPKVWRLYQPIAVAASNDGKRAYVADYGQALLYIFDFGRNDVKVIGENGGFVSPIGVAVDAADRVYVSDQGAKRIQVLTADGEPLGAFGLEHIGQPGGIAIDRSRGLLYVTDNMGAAAEEHFVRVYDLDGSFVRNVGSARGGGEGELYYPTYVAVGSDGTLFVSDTLNARVAVFDPEGNFVRAIGRRGDNVGEFDKPKGVALDSFGNLYVVDSSWSVVQIFNPRDETLLYFGGRNPYPGMMQNPTGIAIDANNRIYVCDTLNHRLNVYRLVNTTAADSLPDPDEEPAETGDAGAEQKTQPGSSSLGLGGGGRG